MASRRAGGALALALLAILLVATALAVGMLPKPLAAGVQDDATPTPGDQEPVVEGTTTPTSDHGAVVTIYDENGTELGVVDATVAADPDERYTGLSPYESLANGSGKLFVYEEEGRHAFVMREMDFPLDIVFIGANGTINVVHEAPLPPEGTEGSDLKRYRGTGKWVLEVPRGWMAAQGIEAGDRVAIEYVDSPPTITTAPEDDSS